MITQQTLANPLADELPIDNALVIGSRQGRMDSFTSQDTPIDSPSTGDEAADSDEAETDQDEPVDEEGDPTGEHDHHQDDNYALGGHVTRSGSI